MGLSLPLALAFYLMNFASDEGLAGENVEQAIQAIPPSNLSQLALSSFFTEAMQMLEERTAGLHKPVRAEFLDAAIPLYQLEDGKQPALLRSREACELSQSVLASLQGLKQMNATLCHLESLARHHRIIIGEKYHVNLSSRFFDIDSISDEGEELSSLQFWFKLDEAESGPAILYFCQDYNLTSKVVLEQWSDFALKGQAILKAGLGHSQRHEVAEFHINFSELGQTTIENHSDWLHSDQGDRTRRVIRIEMHAQPVTTLQQAELGTFGGVSYSNQSVLRMNENWGQVLLAKHGAVPYQDVEYFKNLFDAQGYLLSPHLLELQDREALLTTANLPTNFDLRRRLSDFTPEDWDCKGGQVLDISAAFEPSRVCLVAEQGSDQSCWSDAFQTGEQE